MWFKRLLNSLNKNDQGKICLIDQNQFDRGKISTYDYVDGIDMWKPYVFFPYMENEVWVLYVVENLHLLLEEETTDEKLTLRVFGKQFINLEIQLNLAK